MTFSVLKLLISNFFKFSHLENILDISITFEVLKLDKSSSSKDSQLINIFDISVTFEVSKSVKLISEILTISSNIPWQFVIGSFQNNSIRLFASVKLIWESTLSISFPFTNILFGNVLNDLFKINCIPILFTFKAIFEVDSSFLKLIEAFEEANRQNRIIDKENICIL